MSWEDPKVKQAAETYAKILNYQNADHPAAKLGSGGQGYDGRPVRVYCNGRLTYGELVKLKLKDNEDFGWVSFPGTDEAFIFVSDGFTLAKGAPHKQECIEWLKVCGKEGQEAFNPLKGSIRPGQTRTRAIWPVPQLGNGVFRERYVGSELRMAKRPQRLSNRL